MIIKNEVKKCLLCSDAPCNKGCKVDIARIIRAGYFYNSYYSIDKVKDLDCSNCDAMCETNCINDLNIREIVKFYKNWKLSSDITGYENIDLTSSVCGIKLENPFLLSSSVVGSNYEMVSRAFDLGWAGVVYKTISFINIQEASPRFSILRDFTNNIYGFKNIEQLSDMPFEENLEIFRKLKKNYPNKALVVSIMGRNEEEWEYIAKRVSETGADAIELNFSCPNMEEGKTGVEVGQNPELCKKYTAAARRGTNIPIIAKLTPNITDMCKIARACVEAGANGIAAINTVKSITNLNYDKKKKDIENVMVGGYSGRAVKPIALRYISDLAKDPKLKDICLSGMGGIEIWRDAAEFIMLGCESVQVTTAVMLFGYRIIDDLISGLQIFMRLNDYKTIDEFKGIGIDNVIESHEVDRKTIVYPSLINDRCIGCERCYVSCSDGGHQAISIDPNTRKPVFNYQKCVGCFLCSLVCPTKAIDKTKRVLNPRYINSK